MHNPEIRHRICIFQADWPLQSQTANCAFVLARAGYEVDLFLDNVPQEYFDIQSSPEFQAHSHIHLHIFGGHERKIHYPFLMRFNNRFATKCFAFAAKLFRRARIALGLQSSFIGYAAVRQSTACIEGRKFILLIGVEKKGLIWAGIMGDHFSIPYIYYSLELYTKDHPDAMINRQNRSIKSEEAFYHQKAIATIIQDADRAHALFQDNGIAGGLAFYIPVSLLGAPRREASSFFRDKYNLPPTQKIILQFGLLYHRRFSSELIDVAEKLNANRTLILHGYSLSRTYQRFLEKKKHSGIILSQNLVPLECIPEIIASADIGLVLYTADTQNDFLTAFASEKLALLLQHGKPIIAFDYPGYQRLIAQYECGVLIQSLSDLPQAVEKILSDWDHFSRNAMECFKMHYDYAKNAAPMIDWINQGLPSTQDMISGVHS